MPEPQTLFRDHQTYLTDGGLETTLVFHDKIDLPCFASFPLMTAAKGRDRLRTHYQSYAAIARRHGFGFVFDSPTWRANPDWGLKLGYSSARLASVNRNAIYLMRELRQKLSTAASPMIVSGCVGPRGDGYQANAVMTPEDAEAYHAEQIGAFKEAGADMVGAMTMTNANEAVGVARAARAEGLPAVISFTLEIDGRLPSGETLASAIATVDAATDRAPVCFMVNCAHPAHFDGAFAEKDGWRERMGGLRVNASMKSHAELDAATELDAGDPAALGGQCRELAGRFPRVRVMGGCCGTDHRHIESIAMACRRMADAA